MSKVIKVGILGCGQIAQIMHLPYLDDLEGFEIYSICDVSKELLNKVGKKYSVPAERQFLDYEKMIADPNLDAVFICSKDHCQPTIQAANAKKHVFVEKPFGFSVSQAEQMVKAAEDNNVKLMVGYMKRYDTGYQYALEKIKAMENISLVRFHDFGGSFAYTRNVFDVLSGADVDPAFFAQGKKEVSDAQLAGIGTDNKDYLAAYSLLLGVSSHDSILMRHAFGDDPEVLYADVHNGSFLTAILKFGNIECIFESGLVMKRAIWDENMTVYSDFTNLKLEFPWPYLKNAPSVVKLSENVPGTDMPSESEVKTSFSEAYRNELLHFYDCIVNDKEPITSGKDALKDIKLMRKIIDAVGGKK